MNLTKFEKIAGWAILLPLYFFFGPLIFSFLFALILRVGHVSMGAVELNSWYNLFYDTGMLIIAVLIFHRFLKEEFRQIKGRWIRTILWSFLVCWFN